VTKRKEIPMNCFENECFVTYAILTLCRFTNALLIKFKLDLDSLDSNP
jgi:hypothetical protein